MVTEKNRFMIATLPTFKYIWPPTPLSTNLQPRVSLRIALFPISPLHILFHTHTRGARVLGTRLVFSSDKTGYEPRGTS